MKVKVCILCLLGLFLFPSALLLVWKVPALAPYVPETLEKVLQDFFPETREEIILNYANSLYRQKKFQKALLQYKKLQDTTSTRKPIVGHNIGNTYYRLGEEKRKTAKIDTYHLRNFSILSYQDALWGQNTDQLRTKSSKQTQENLIFVRQELEKLAQELKDEGIEDLPPPPPPIFEENGQANPNPPPPSNIPQHQPSSPDSPPPRPKPSPKTEEQNTPGENNSDVLPPEGDDGVREFPKADSDKIDESQLLDNAGLSEAKQKEIEKHIRDLKKDENVNIQLNKPSLRSNNTLFDVLNDPYFDSIDPNESAW